MLNIHWENVKTATVDNFSENHALFSDHFHLDDVERALFDIACRYHSCSVFEGLVDAGIESEHAKAPSLLSLLLGVSKQDIKKRLSKGAPLITSGLLSIDEWDLRKGSFYLEPVENLITALSYPNHGMEDIRNSLVGPTGRSKLIWDNFNHLSEQRDFAGTVLKSSLENKTKGVNILLYGEPGTGKTEFSKVLTQHINANLHMAGEIDDSGSEPTRKERLNSYTMAQKLLGDSENTVLLFDEMEDLLSQDRNDRAGGSKVFFNRLLENNTTPTIWTTNDIYSFDPATLRRMTIAIEFKLPPTSAREKVWHDLLEQHDFHLSKTEVSSLAKDFKASPALAANAIRATQLIGGDVSHIKLALCSILKTIDGSFDRPIGDSSKYSYDEGLINTDIKLSALTQTLSQPNTPKNFSFCLYGQPGTGKSAYTRHLAECMGLEVMHKRASDLMSMWVGGTEKNIAEAFSEAKEEGHFLIIDEADSMLQDRSGASRSWEISQVNEMLTWMEVHPLPFACTTNLMDSLDSASLRRFTFKVKFNYLSEQQVLHAFQHFFNLKAPSQAVKLKNLTPGDFAVVAKKARFMNALDDSLAIQSMLTEESNGKPGYSNPIGFGRG